MVIMQDQEEKHLSMEGLVVLLFRVFQVDLVAGVQVQAEQPAVAVADIRVVVQPGSEQKEL